MSSQTRNSSTVARRMLPPQLPRDIIERARLTGLSAILTQYRLVLVHAPAGSGKTTLLSQWHDLLRQSRQEVLWYSLRSDEKDPLGLADYLLIVLGIDSEAAPASSEDREEALQRVRAALEEKCHQRAVTLFVDDFHLCEEDDGIRTVSVLMAARIPGLTLVLASRSRPRLPLGRYRASGEMSEISVGELQFSADEAEAFFRAGGLDEIPEALSQELEDRIEGWAAGLRLMALVMRRSGGSDALAEALRGGHRDFVEYFLEEVLAGLPPGTRDFLIETSILDSLSTDLCRAVTGREDAGPILDALEEAKLFIVTLPGVQRWYRYHHLFQEFLQNRLFLRGAAAGEELHRRAANWFLAAGSPLEAVSHAFAAKDAAWAAELIERYCLYDYLSFGRFETYARWMQQLPREAREARPLLMFLFVWRMINRRRFHQAEQLLDTIEAGEAGQGDRATGRRVRLAPAELDVPGRLHLMRALVGAYSSDLAAARRHIDALTDIRLDDLAFGQRDLDSIHSYVALREGQLDLCERLTWKAHREYDEIACHWGVIHSLCIAGMAQLARGLLDEAAETFARARERASAHFSERSYMVALSTALLGQAEFLRGNFGPAERFWEQALGPEGVPDHTGLVERVLVPAVGLAQLYDLTGRGERSAALLASVSRRAFEEEDFGAELVLATERANRAFRHGDASLGRRELDRAELQLAEARRRFPQDIWQIWESYACARARALAASGDIAGMGKELWSARIRAERDGRTLSVARLDWLRCDLEGRERCQTSPVQGLLPEAAMPGQPGADSVTDAEARAAGDEMANVRLDLLRRQYRLTEREAEVLFFVSQGFSNARIAENLGINLNTVKTHTGNIFGKLGVSNRTQVAMMVLR